MSLKVKKMYKFIVNTAYMYMVLHSHVSKKKKYLLPLKPGY